MIVVEMDGPLNECPVFAPIQRRLRGRFDARRVAGDGASKLAQDWPEGIPGQRIALDGDKGYVIEPLHDPKYAKTRAKAEKLGPLLPEREEVPAHAPTWRFWLKRLVEAGLAKVVEGSLPDDIGGEPQLSFITDSLKSPTERLAEAIEKQTALLAELLTKRKAAG